MLAWWLLVHAGMAGIRRVVAAMSGEVGWLARISTQVVRRNLLR
jgi:hypothetical protein